MNSNKYQFLIFIILLIWMPFLHSQNGNCPAEGKTLQMNNSCSNVSNQYKARDKITFSEGYKFNTNNGVMKAKLEETLVVPKDDYHLTQINESEIEIDKSLDVGLISGTGSVNLDGSASYNIPIGIPSGTAGLEPNLSIIYNSNLPNGMLGKGWTVSGISSINRISKTVFNSYSGTTFKGDLTGVNLNFNDFFSLDGNRLVLENPNDPSVYGNDNIIYRTFMESFVKIKSHGTAGNGPDWFEVFLPDGSIAEYGRTNNSKGMLENATTPLFWNINKVTDKHGNFMEFFYKVHNYEVVIEKVEYTGNNNANVSPYNTILFLYEEKQDKNFYYIGGAKQIKLFCCEKLKL